MSCFSKRTRHDFQLEMSSYILITKGDRLVGVELKTFQCVSFCSYRDTKLLHQEKVLGGYVCVLQKL